MKGDVSSMRELLTCPALELPVVSLVASGGAVHFLHDLGDSAASELSCLETPQLRFLLLMRHPSNSLFVFACDGHTLPFAFMSDWG